MKKRLEGGKILVIFAPDSKYGWYTSHNKEELIFDHELIQMVKNGSSKRQIQIYCESHYGPGRYSGAGDLKIDAVEPCSKFLITRGLSGETVIKETDFNWITS